MMWLHVAGLLLLLAQASLAATSNEVSSPANTSETLLHRSKRSLFVPAANCPEPVYLTQAQVSEWPGITVDTTPALYLDDKNGLNTFKCSDDTFFVYTHLPTVLTRQNWWLVCGINLRNGWRVTDAGGRNTAYGMIPVGCIKPTCTGLQLFDGSEYVLTTYPTYQVVPNKPTIVGINQKFTFTCPAGSTFGYAPTAATITLDATAKITCEAEGWWVRTKSDLTGKLLSSRVGCFKIVAAPPSTLPAQCQTGLNYYTETTSIASGADSYVVTADKAVAINGQWALVCPTGRELGYVITATALGIDPTVRITCESSGWWIKTGEDAIGYTLPSMKYGCFLRQPKRLISCLLPLVPNIPTALLPSGFVPNNDFELASWRGSPSEQAYGCKLNNGTALAQFIPNGPIVALKRPTFTCNGDGIWTGGPGGTGSQLMPIYFSCITFPAAFKLEGEVAYTYTGGSLYIVPLLPAYKYCPEGRQSILPDGTIFTSITTSDRSVSPISYDAKLVNGNTFHTSTSGSYNVACSVQVACPLPLVPNIPTALLPSGFVANNDFALASWRGSPSEQAYGCKLNNGTALAQFLPNGPIVALKRPTFTCNGDGIWTGGPGGTGKMLKPIYFSCISFPAGFTLEGEVEYTYTGGSLYIVPLLPAYKYCPEGRQSILADGTPFTSITTSDRFRSPINFDVKLLDGSSVRTTTKDWFKVACSGFA